MKEDINHKTQFLPSKPRPTSAPPKTDRLVAVAALPGSEATGAAPPGIPPRTGALKVARRLIQIRVVVIRAAGWLLPRPALVPYLHDCDVVWSVRLRWVDGEKRPQVARMGMPYKCITGYIATW